MHCLQWSRPKNSVHFCKVTRPDVIKQVGLLKTCSAIKCHSCTVERLKLNAHLNDVMRQ